QQGQQVSHPFVAWCLPKPSGWQKRPPWPAPTGGGRVFGNACVTPVTTVTAARGRKERVRTATGYPEGEPGGCRRGSQVSPRSGVTSPGSAPGWVCRCHHQRE